MTPGNTVYRLAKQPDYRACHALMRKAMSDFVTEPRGKLRLKKPTVVADRGGDIVGFISTIPSKKAIIAGPILASPELPSPTPVLLHLIEAYDNLLRAVGVTSYLFYVQTNNNPWINILEKVGMQPFASKGDFFWYKRAI